MIPAPDDFLSCDWGTTNFRLRLLRGTDLGLIDELVDGAGVASFSAHGEDAETRTGNIARYFAEAARSLLQRHRIEVARCAISGMASSRMGWHELPYADLPQAVDGGGLISKTFPIEIGMARPLEVTLVSGLSSGTDVMRGEETEVIGLAELIPEIAAAPDARVILPGTHSKHIHLRDGKIVDFSTYMTGELFAVLSGMPTLKQCLENGAADPDSPQFTAGVRSGSQRAFSSNLFRIRATHLLDGATAGECASRLSGTLIGMELEDLAGPDTKIFIAAQGHLAKAYTRASGDLGLLGVSLIRPREIGNAVASAHRTLLARAGR